MIGTILGGRYEILEVIGSGGMAIVYKAKCNLLGRYVAVKMLREELQNDKDFVERFKAEARSAASLNHPNVVSVYDVGTDGDREYFVMEYIEGITLKELIDTKQLNWKTACSYGIQIAGAIDHAHKKSIVHRDIKPHNIMITKDNVVKVTDFGIARAVTSSTIVRAGNVIGSVHYFSPEQACGGAVDFKSDIYSMGVVLYEMITGKVPFDAENPVAIAKMHVDNEAQPPIEINAEIPETLSDIVLKAMAKQPMKRYQTPAAMAADLKQVAVNPESINIKDNDATQFVPVVKPSDESTYTPGSDKIVIKDEYTSEDRGRKTASKAAWIMAAVVFVISAFIIVATIFPGAFGFGERIEIPDFRGKTYEEALKICEEKGFTLEKEEGGYSDKYGVNEIMEQQPAAGLAKKTDTIVVKISKGLDKITLKDYTGKDINEVQKELEEFGVLVNIDREEHDEMPIDAIIKQSPSAKSTVKPGSVVHFYVSDGKEKVKVPSITGVSVERAEERLNLLGLELGTITEVEDEDNVGKVINQSVEEGEEIERGTKIDVTVGKSPTTTPEKPDSPSVSGGQESQSGDEGSTAMSR